MANLPQPRIAIAGAGAIGGYYGARLWKAGADVHFLLRGDYPAARVHGLRVRETQGGFAATVPPERCYHDPRAIGPCGLVIVAAKATANPHLPAAIEPLLDEGSLILTLQNGMGNAEFFAGHFGPERILGGLCFVCINRVAPARIENYLRGQVIVGDFTAGRTDRAEALAALFEDAGIPCKATPSLEEALWRKLCWNVPFNGLAIAAGGIPTDRILASEALSALARDLMEEIRSAAAAAGYALEDAFLERQFAATRGMGAYKPSSLLDYLEGRPVEVEALFGEPTRRAAAHGRPMPRVEALYRLIAGLCAQRGGARPNAPDTPFQRFHQA